MSLIDAIRKGAGYVLMALGASNSQALKKKPAAAPAPKPDPRRE